MKLKQKKIFSFMVLMAVALASYFVAQAVSESEAKGQDKVTLCHFPPDTPDNPQTILVGRKSVADHLGHGDCRGACVDTDSDGIFDGCDLCPNDAGNDADGDGVCGDLDGCPFDGQKTEPGICGCGVSDVDTDGDQTADCNDGCPSDAGKTEPGICGCGVSDADSDSDGTADCNDGCPNDANKIAAGVCGCGVADTDSDNDGTPDCNDGCPSDPEKTEPGACGCNTPEIDADDDGSFACVKAGCAVCNDCDDSDSDIHPNLPGEQPRPDNSCDGIDIDCSQPYGGCEPKDNCFGRCLNGNTQQECGEWDAGCSVFVSCGSCDQFHECFNGSCCLPRMVATTAGGQCGQRVDDLCGGTTVVICATGACEGGVCQGSGSGCLPQSCEGAQCGDSDACGGFCPGSCPTGGNCVNIGGGIGFTCLGDNIPACSSVECGFCISVSTFMDKSCPDGQDCNQSGQCVTSSCSSPCNQLEECNLGTGECECCGNTDLFGNRTCTVCGADEYCATTLIGIDRHCCNIFQQLCL